MSNIKKITVAAIVILIGFILFINFKHTDTFTIVPKEAIFSSKNFIMTIEKGDGSFGQGQSCVKNCLPEANETHPGAIAWAILALSETYRLTGAVSDKEALGRAIDKFLSFPPDTMTRVSGPQIWRAYEITNDPKLAKYLYQHISYNLGRLDLSFAQEGFKFEALMLNSSVVRDLVNFLSLKEQSKTSPPAQRISSLFGQLFDTQIDKAQRILNILIEIIENKPRSYPDQCWYDLSIIAASPFLHNQKQVRGIVELYENDLGDDFLETKNVVSSQEAMACLETAKIIKDLNLSEDAKFSEKLKISMRSLMSSTWDSSNNSICFGNNSLLPVFRQPINCLNPIRYLSDSAWFISLTSRIFDGSLGEAL